MLKFPLPRISRGGATSPRTQPSRPPRSRQPSHGHKGRKKRIHIKKKEANLMFASFFCGKAGIRTLGTRKGTTVFETAPIDHSGTFP